MKLFNKLKVMIFWFIVGVSFVVASSFLVVTATGYKVNVSLRKIQKTSLVIIKSTPRDAIVYLNGKALNEKTPLRKTGLIPDHYDIKVEKSGHQSWQRFLQIEEGIGYNLDHIILPLKDPVIASVEDLPAGGFQGGSSDPALYTNNGEIWYRDKLVTRLSQDIKNAVVYPDREHIVFQVGDEIRIVDFDGSNIRTLIKLDGDEKILFGFQDDDTLIFQVGDKLKRARIL